MRLTLRQEDILSFLRDSAEERGMVPSVREIMERFGFASPATVSGHLDLLEKKGAIRREPGRSRNILLSGFRPRSEVPATIGIPVYGMIPAGIPEGQEQESDRLLQFDPALLRFSGNGETFALQVRGDSMRGAGILDGDHVILEVAEPREGEIVAALIDGEVTLKRYLRLEGEPYLRAENPDYPDLIPARELLVQGVFRALLRTRPC